MKTPGLIKMDPWLAPFHGAIQHRIDLFDRLFNDATKYGSQSLLDYASGYKYFGLHKDENNWIFREWAPNATKIFLTGEFNNWEDRGEFQLKNLDHGIWEIKLPLEAIKHKDLYKIHIYWNGGDGFRIPSYANRVWQNPENHLFDAQVWSPEDPFKWSDNNFMPNQDAPLIYEAHIGMGGEDEKVSSYNEFQMNVLPRIIKAGYNTIQFMAIQEHPYYGSFGYHVSNYFAASSRFGTPEELKELINEAHLNGITVIMDIVHSHAVKNELEGLSNFDGTKTQYFHAGERGEHPAWDSRCFDYGKKEVIHFLTSNCVYWLDEYHFDGYRFDGVTSMLYYNHGLGKDFTQYSDYFCEGEDMDAMAYLTLANKAIHTFKPNAITVAEEMSGMPGLAGLIEDGGIGFDYRLSMGVPDFWIKLIKEQPDEKWNVGQIFHELGQHRPEEKTITYAESHDQALVGDKTIIFRLIDKDMYFSMSKFTPNIVVDRGIAIHKMIRLITISTNHGGYLNFMGNEFGHPEWIDFPREGNDWSYQYARRQWNLMDNKDLKYHWLSDFDQKMIEIMRSETLQKLPPFEWVTRNEADQVLCYKRGDLLFVFNFNPTTSFTDYGIDAPSGKYKIIFNSDNSNFGGFNRIDESIRYIAAPNEWDFGRFLLKLYIPSRTAFVMKFEPTQRVH